MTYSEVLAIHSVNLLNKYLLNRFGKHPSKKIEHLPCMYEALFLASQKQKHIFYTYIYIYGKRGTCYLPDIT